MSQRKSDRVLGPYRDAGRDRWRLILADAEGGRRTLYYPTEAAARAAARRLSAELADLTARTVGDAVDAYGEHLAGEVKPVTRAQNLYRLGRFLAGAEGLELRRLTTEKCAELYAALRSTGLAVDSHRAMLGAVRTWLRWCVGQGWIASNPAEGVRGQGRRRRGKTQLRIDEARRWRDVALALAPREPGALAALLTLYLSMRASEITGLRVRDVDDGGRVIWIAESKTEAGRRCIEVPEQPATLRALLVALAGDRPGDALLFGRHWRDWPREWVQRICELAGVPRVTAHGMRGLGATLAVAAGLAPELVAASLGHEDPAVTLAHYAQAGAVETSRRRAALTVLEGGLGGAPAPLLQPLSSRRPRRKT
jgi:integrase